MYQSGTKLNANRYDLLEYINYNLFYDLHARINGRKYCILRCSMQFRSPVSDAITSLTWAHGKSSSLIWFLFRLFPFIFRFLQIAYCLASFLAFWYFLKRNNPWLDFANKSIALILTSFIFSFHFSHFHFIRFEWSVQQAILQSCVKFSWTSFCSS